MKQATSPYTRSMLRTASSQSFNEQHSRADAFISLINLLLLLQLFAAGVVSRVLQGPYTWECTVISSRACSAATTSTASQQPGGFIGAGLVSMISAWWSVGLSPVELMARVRVVLNVAYVMLHVLVIFLSWYKPGQYITTWRCPLMLSRRLLMPAANLLFAWWLTPSVQVAQELLGQHRIAGSTLELALHSLMYPVPMPLHMVAVLLRALMQVALLWRCGHLSLLTPGTILTQVLFGIAAPTAVLYILQRSAATSLNPFRKASAQRFPAAPLSSTPAKHSNTSSSTANENGTHPSIDSSPSTTYSPSHPECAAANTSRSAHHVQALASANAPPASQHAPKAPRSHYSSADPQAESLVSPVEAAAAAAAAAAAVKDVAIQEPKHITQPTSRRQRAMYKPRIKPALLISVKMHHNPGLDFDQLAPALRQSAFQALHKYDCASVLAASSGNSLSTGPAALGHRLEVQSTCIPGCVHLLLSVTGACSTGSSDLEALEWAQGLATSLYLGVLESQVGEHLRKVIVQVGGSSFTYNEGELQASQEVVQVGGAGSLEDGAASNLDWRKLEGSWVWTGWVQAAGGEAELQLGCAGALLAGKKVRVVVTQGAEGKVVLDARGVQIGDDGFGRVTTTTPSCPTAWHLYVIDDDDHSSAAVLHSAPVLVLLPTCCRELDSLLADALQGNVEGFHVSSPAVAECTAAALAALAPMLEALQSILLHQSPGSCSPALLSPGSDAAASELLDYCLHNSLPDCAQLVSALVTSPGMHPAEGAAAPPAMPASAAAPASHHSATARSSSSKPWWLPGWGRKPVPISATMASMQAAGKQATASHPEDTASRATALASPLPNKAGLSAVLWGFSNPFTEQRYTSYKAWNSTLNVDQIAALWCIASMLVSTFFGGSSWLLWLAIDSARLLKYAVLLSRHRSRLAPHRDVILCVGRAAVALAMVALLLAGRVVAPDRTGVAQMLECHIVLLSCGILRPVLYQVGLSWALALALVAEAWLCALLHSSSCGLLSAVSCSTCTFGVGLVATAAMEARCRIGFLQQQHVQRRGVKEGLPAVWHAGRAPDAKTV